MKLKRITRAALVLLAILGLAFPARGETQAQGLSGGDRIALCGDSITEQKLYSVMIEVYLRACLPRNLQPSDVAQFGWSGERAAGFLQRLGRDTSWYPLTVATLCYGMNDGGYAPFQPVTGTAYHDNLTEIVRKLKSSGVRLVVVGSPGVVDPATFVRPSVSADDYNKALERLASIARGVAEEEHVRYADVNGAMRMAMVAAKQKYGAGYVLAGKDGIHPQRNGHLVMAYAFLRALGCEGEIGVLHWDAANGTASASEGHKIVGADARQVVIESRRYPFCFSDDPAAPDSTASIVGLLPFNSELNRFQLVVTGLKTHRVRLTWGSGSRVYTSEELGRGVNLAADFRENPFSGPFQALVNAVTAKQQVETPLVKSVIHEGVQLSAAAPRTYGHFRDELLETRQRCDRDIEGLLLPVTHKIILESVP